MNGIESNRRTVISHAHARDLAECWQDAAREQHPITLLARTGEITNDAQRCIAYDLDLLEMASSSWGSPPSIPEKQLRVLLQYVRHHGPRPPVEGWSGLRDAEFLRYGSIHRNAYLNAPATLGPALTAKDHDQLFFAGQLTGVEGYRREYAWIPDR